MSIHIIYIHYIYTYMHMYIVRLHANSLLVCRELAWI